MISEEKIAQNWDRLLKLVDTYFTGERRERLLEMYEYFSERMPFAPASGKEQFHNAFPGGYVDHVLNVIDNALAIKKIWEQTGARIDFSDESLVFCAMHHDLGKVGDLHHDYYVFNDSEWHRIHQGKIYSHNKKCLYMTVTDRALYLLHHFMVPITHQEWIAIRLADGMYEDANKSYLKAYDVEFQLKTELPHILHQADLMASRVEYDKWRFANGIDKASNEPDEANGSDESATNEEIAEKIKKFDELFEEKKL